MEPPETLRDAVAEFWTWLDAALPGCDEFTSFEKGEEDGVWVVGMSVGLPINNPKMKKLLKSFSDRFFFLKSFDFLKITYVGSRAFKITIGPLSAVDSKKRKRKISSGPSL